MGCKSVKILISFLSLEVKERSEPQKKYFGADRLLTEALNMKDD